jgi:preprotein translocase SecF subunit
MIRIQTKKDEQQAVVVARVKEIISETIDGTVDYRKIDFVGPTVGDELVTAGITATLLAFAAIMAYVWFRFEWQFGVGAILALLHDSIMMVGFFAVTQFEFSLTALAAILTIVGYSINDSVVIYDRIRENMRKYKKMSMEDLLNLSINDTISRTILTVCTTLIAALCLALFGGEVLKGFSWSLVFGLVVGTYSSIYIAAPTLIYLNLRRLYSKGETEDANNAVLS